MGKVVRVALAGLAALAGVLWGAYVLFTAWDTAKAALCVVAGAMVAAFITPE